MSNISATAAANAAPAPTPVAPWSLTVNVMAYNEVAALRATCEDIGRVLAGVGRPYEVVIIDDGSTDGTGALADELARSDSSIRVVHHTTNRGLGGVYRTAYYGARNDLVTCYPADGQFPPETIAAMLPLMAEHDMVLGYVPERRAPLVATMLSAFEIMLYRALFGRLPKFRGIMMFRRALLSDFGLRSEGRGWAIAMELIIRAARGPYRVLSIPIAYRPREKGSSKVNNLRTIWANVKQVLALRWRL